MRLNACGLCQASWAVGKWGSSIEKTRLTSPSEKAILRATGETRRYIRPAAYRQDSLGANHREFQFTGDVLFARLRDVPPVCRQGPETERWRGANQRVILSVEGSG